MARTDRHHADVIVIGGGTMGTAAGWALARSGHSAIVLEQFHHVHTNGSHGGKTRLFRHAYGEGEQYVPWTLEADRLWTDLQACHQEELMVRCGGLDLAAPGRTWARKARASAETHGLPYEWMTGDEVNARFPGWNLPSDWEASFEPTAGLLVVEPALRALAQEMTAAGGVMVEQAKVTSWTTGPDGVEVATSTGTYSGDRLIITAGAWSGQLLGDLGISLSVRRNPVYWFRTTDDTRFSPDRFPVWAAEDTETMFYGVPHYDEPGMKSGIQSKTREADPDALDRRLLDGDLPDDYVAFLTTRLNGVSQDFCNRAVCMFTNSLDEHFIIDRHPADDRVVFFCGDSGHGFKFAPIVGKHLAELATSLSVESIPFFRYDRPGLRDGSGGH